MGPTLPQPKTELPQRKAVCGEAQCVAPFWARSCAGGRLAVGMGRCRNSHRVSDPLWREPLHAKYLGRPASQQTMAADTYVADQRQVHERDDVCLTLRADTYCVRAGGAARENALRGRVPVRGEAAAGSCVRKR